MVEQAGTWMGVAWRRLSGWWRVTVVAVLLVLATAGGIVGLTITLLVLLLGLSARVGAAVTAVRTRPVRRYAQEVERTQATLAERLRWAEQEVAARDAHIARLLAEQEADRDRP